MLVKNKLLMFNGILIIIFTFLKIVDILATINILKLENIYEFNPFYHIFYNNIILFILWQITPTILFTFYNLKNRHNIRKLKKIKIISKTLIIILIGVIMYTMILSNVLGIVNL